MYKPGFNCMFKLTNFLLLIFSTVIFISCTSDIKERQHKAEIVILMPMSGDYGDKSAKLAELIKWGIEDKGAAANISIKDISTYQQIEQASEELRFKRADIILGPLFSENVKIFSKIAKENNIIMLTLSNNPILAEENNIFIFGHGPLKQIDFLLDYLIEKDHKDYLLIMPSNRYSINMKKAYEEMINYKGGKLLSSHQYDIEQENSLEKAVENIEVTIDESIENVDSNSKPVLLLAAKDPASLKKLYKILREKNLDTKSLIAGDARIDIGYKGDINLIFTGSRMIPSAVLSERARIELGISHFNYLENLAYDLGSFTGELIGHNFTKDDFINRVYNNNFLGLSGNIKFEDAVAKRDYEIIKREGEFFTILKD